MDIFWTWPPVTRTLVAATVVTSLLVHTGSLAPYYVVFLKEQIWQMPPKISEIWRLVSPFLITGPKFGLLMDPYFLFTYAASLERDSPRFLEAGSFPVYLVFVMGTILLANVAYLGGVVFLQPLILALAYTFSQDNPNNNVTIYILTFPAKYLPFALITLTFVMDGPGAAKQQLAGLVAAHLYDFLTRIWPTFGGGRNYIQTPNFVKRIFVDGTAPAPTTRSYGTAFQPREEAPPGGGNWSGTRGPGRRLGD